MFADNSALEGGGIRFCFFIGALPEPTIARNTLVDNDALTLGGGIAIYDADPVIENCTLDGNDAGTSGGGLHAAQCSTAPLVTNTIVSNSTSGGGVALDSAVLTTSFCNVWSNEGGDYVGCTPGPTDISEDPLYCSIVSRDLTLRDDSPCLPGNNPWNELIGAHEAGGCGTSVDGTVSEGGLFQLSAPFPNPAAGPVALGYEISEAGVVVELTVLTVAGRVVRRLEVTPGEPGTHEVVWDARDAHGRPVAAGAYVVRGRAAGHTSYRGVVILGD